MIFLGLILGVIFAVIAFISTNTIWVALAVMGLTIIYFLFIVNPTFKKMQDKTTRFHECYRFINTFIISLSIKGATKGTLETTVSSMSESFKKEYELLLDMSEGEKIHYLHKYFNFHIYQLFTDLFDLWEEEGGNILDMSTHLINECRLVEEYINECSSISKKKIGEFSILWTFSLIILVVLRFSLSTFYTMLTKQMFFQVSIIGIFAFLLVSIHIFLSKVSKIEIDRSGDNR